MRLALLSDVHGNTIALDAVLADIEQNGGVDGYWVLGDLVAIARLLCAAATITSSIAGSPTIIRP